MSAKPAQLIGSARLYVAICLAGCAAAAQLATTGDGHQLYFADGVTLLRYNNGAWEQIASLPETATASDGTAFQFELEWPQVTADGTLLTYEGVSTCAAGPTCDGSFARRGIVLGPEVPPAMTAYGALAVSRNGRFLLRYGGTRTVSPGPPLLYDRQTGEFTFIRDMTLVGDGHGCLTDDGAVLLLNGVSRVVLWRAGDEIREVPIALPALWARVTADGSRVLYESGVRGDYHRLALFDVATREEFPLAIGPLVPPPIARPLFGNPQAPVVPYFGGSMSDDGSVLLYYSKDGGWLLHRGRIRQFTSEPVTAGVVSGYGNVAYAVAAGELIELDPEL